MESSPNELSSSTKKTSQGGLQRFATFVAEHRKAGKPAGRFEDFEDEVRELVSLAEAELLGIELSRHDIDAPAIYIDGDRYGRVGRHPDSYMTSASPVRVERTIYRRADDEKAVCPMEMQAGIVGGWWTPRAAKIAVWEVAHLPAGEAEESFVRKGAMAPSRASLDRLPKELSARWEERRVEFEQSVRVEEESIPAEAVSVAACLDGVMVPMTDALREVKRAALEDDDNTKGGPRGHKEACCATLAFYDADGERILTRYLGRMPEKGKETIKGMLRDELEDVLMQRPDLALVMCADGAKDNWRYIRKLARDFRSRCAAVFLCLDFFHAVQHLKDALDAAHCKMPKSEADAQFKAFRSLLRDKQRGVSSIIRHLSKALVKLPKNATRRRKDLRREIDYFRKHRKHMNFARLRARGLPIGSGVVEAANKTLVVVRMKRSGSHWRLEGGQAVLTFRALSKSGRFDLAWCHLSATYQMEVQLGDKVVPLRSVA